MVAGLCRKKARVYMYLGASAFIKAPRYIYTLAGNIDMEHDNDSTSLKNAKNKDAGSKTGSVSLKMAVFKDARPGTIAND